MKSPAFQFYPNDWLSSGSVTLMEPAQEGAYIRLLCYDWAQDGIPDDDTVLSRLSRLNEGWFNGGSTVVKKCFIPHPNKPGHLTNPRIQIERKKQQIWSEKSRQGGLKSAEKRNKNTSNPRVVQPKGNRTVEPKGNSIDHDHVYVYDLNSPLSPPKGEPEKKPRTRKTALPRMPKYTHLFETLFWAPFPNEGKTDKAQAFEVWEALGVEADLFLQGEIQAGVMRYARIANPGYTKTAMRWLKDRRWEDRKGAPQEGVHEGNDAIKF